MKKRKNDIMLVAVIGFIALLLWLIIYITRSEGAFVRVTVDGGEYGTYPLDADAEIFIRGDGAYNILVIKDGEAAVLDASCPDKLCMHQGKIRYDGQSIICLPNKVVVEIVGGGQSEYDAVTR